MNKISCRLSFLVWMIGVLMPSIVFSDVFTEIKGAYFRPSSETFRDIYSTRGIYGFEVTGRIWHQWYLFGSGDYFHTTGKSLNFHNRSTLTLVPCAVGVKYLFPVRPVDFYLGAGIVGAYVHIDDHSPYVVQSNSKWTVGGIFKGGVVFNMTQHWFLDLFANYMLLNVDFSQHKHHRVYRHQADLSGTSIGLGLGYRFGGA